MVAVWPGCRAVVAGPYQQKLLTLVVAVVGAVSLVENSADCDNCGKNRPRIVLNSLWTSLWKTQNPRFFNTRRGELSVKN